MKLEQILRQLSGQQVRIQNRYFVVDGKLSHTCVTHPPDGVMGKVIYSMRYQNKEVWGFQVPGFEHDDVSSINLETGSDGLLLTTIQLRN